MLKLNEKQQLSTKTLAELTSLARDLEKDIMKAVMAATGRQVKNVRESKKLKHKLAVIKTFINLKKNS